MRNTITFAFTICLVLFSCNKPPYIADFKNVKGYVIAKEVCKTSEADDYWLIDLTYYHDTPRYGDTLVLNGTIYTNVVKVKGLGERLKQIGMAVSIDFKTITTAKTQTTDCTIANPLTYNLKELFILYQGEIR